MIALPCSQCGQELKVRDDFSGRRVKCPQCGSLVAVLPAGATQAAAAAVPAHVLAAAISTEAPALRLERSNGDVMATSPEASVAAVAPAGRPTTIPREWPVVRPDRRLLGWLGQPAVATLMMVVTVAALVVLFTLGAIALRRSNAERDEALEAARQANAAREEGSAHSPLALVGGGKSEQENAIASLRLQQGEQAAYATQLGLIQRELRSGDFARAEQLLEQCRWDQRGFEYGYLWMLAKGRHYSLSATPTNLFGVALSRDGKRLAAGGGVWDPQRQRAKGEVRIWDASTRRPLFVFQGHGFPVNAVAFSPDGRFLATAANDPMNQAQGEIKLWDVESAQEVLTFPQQHASVLGLAFSPDGKQLATATGDVLVRVFDVAAGEELSRLEAHKGAVRAVAYSPDGGLLATAGIDGTVRLWNGEGKELRTLAGVQGWVWSVAFSPDGRRLAAGGSANGVVIWETASGRPLSAFRALPGSESNGFVCGVAFSPDGRYLATTGGDRSVRLWDLDTGEDVRRLRSHVLSPGTSQPTVGLSFAADGRLASVAADEVTLWDGSGDGSRALSGHAGQVLAVATSPDSRLVASGGADGTVRTWNAATGEEERLLGRHRGVVHALAFSPDGRQLASCGDDRAIRVWDLAEGKEAFALTRHSSSVDSVAFSPDGRHLASCQVPTGEVLVWDLQSHEVAYTIPDPDNSLAVRQVTFSPDGRQLALGSMFGFIRIWDVSSRGVVKVLGEQGGGIASMTFSPDGHQLASASFDGTARLWDANTGQRRQVLRGSPAGVNSVSFSADGRRLAVGVADPAGRGGTVQVWDVHSGQQLLTLGRGGAVHGVAFTPDGRRLVAGFDNQTVRVWDAASTPEALTLRAALPTAPGQPPLQMTDVRFSHDGRLLATSSNSGDITLWDASGGVRLLTLHGHTGAVQGLAFSGDDHRLASAGADTTVRIWEVASGREVRALGCKGGALSVALSPDGRFLTAGSNDLQARTWEVANGRLLYEIGHPGPVYGVVYTPDGRLLATAAFGQPVSLWDARTGLRVGQPLGANQQGWVNSVAVSANGAFLASSGQNGVVATWSFASGGASPVIEPPTLFREHRSDKEVWSVVFSPDGKRLASAGEDGTVIVRDLASRQVKLCFRAEVPLWRLDFSPDGKRLAATARDGLVRIWDVSMEENEEARTRLSREQVSGYVARLYASLVRRADVLTQVQRDPNLSDAFRREAVNQAEAYSQDEVRLNLESWNAVRGSGLSSAAYRIALLRAEEACRLLAPQGVPLPDRQDQYYRSLSTLGVAQYRVGEYRDAIDTLSRAERGNASLHGGASCPGDLAFLAMSHYRLGHKEEASALLERLQVAVGAPQWQQYQESKAFLQEAKRLMGIAGGRP